jgi:hypothetical protein
MDTMADVMKDNMKTEAADLSQLVKSEPGNPTQTLHAPVADVPQLKQTEYKDPRDPEYRIHRLNRVGGVENKESDEAIKASHRTMHFSGEVLLK